MISQTIRYTKQKKKKQEVSIAKTKAKQKNINHNLRRQLIHRKVDAHSGDAAHLAEASVVNVSFLSPYSTPLSHGVSSPLLDVPDGPVLPTLGPWEPSAPQPGPRAFHPLTPRVHRRDQPPHRPPTTP